MKRLAATTLSSAAMLLGLPAGASALIVPQQGMAGVRLGMTYAQVRAALGAPTSAYYRRDEVLGRHLLMRYGTVELSLYSTRGSVFSMFTRGRTQRTARGVGVGSPESAVRRLVPGVRCRTEFGVRHCWLGAFLAGRVVTDFRITRGVVSSVVIGRVID